MRGIRYSLLSDGSSDRALMQVIEWSLRHLGARVEQANWAELRVVRNKPRNLAERAVKAIELYPCDVLFVHRDAEGASMESRIDEINKALSETSLRHIPIVPVRMTEAWLLHDEKAIRKASGNPEGRVPLELPPPSRIEKLANPKEMLYDAILLASEDSGRRRRKLKKRLPKVRMAVARWIDDFEPLKAAPAFNRFLQDLENALRETRPRSSAI